MWWGRFAASVLAIAAVSAAGCNAMSAPRARPCSVSGAEKLVAQAGGADALCAAIERAVAAQAPHARYSAEIRVMTDSMLAAKLTVDGRALPEQKFAVMDRKLDQSMIERFAQSIATKVASAARP